MTLLNLASHFIILLLVSSTLRILALEPPSSYPDEDKDAGKQPWTFANDFPPNCRKDEIYLPSLRKCISRVSAEDQDSVGRNTIELDGDVTPPAGHGETTLLFNVKVFNHGGNSSPPSLPVVTPMHNEMGFRPPVGSLPGGILPKLCKDNEKYSFVLGKCILKSRSVPGIG